MFIHMCIHIYNIYIYICTHKCWKQSLDRHATIIIIIIITTTVTTTITTTITIITIITIIYIYIYIYMYVYIYKGTCYDYHY